jgi:Outer membrane protein beta-barrel domain
MRLSKPDSTCSAGTIFTLVLMVLCLATSLSAQQSAQLSRPKVEAKVLFGSAVFVNEDVERKFVGASVRAYVTKRFSIEPEYLYLRYSENDQDHLFQPNVAFDFTDPRGRFVFYGIAGAGVIHHKGRFSGNDFVTGAPILFDTSFTTWTASAGAGVKIFPTKRLFIAPEVRLGREPGLRATISVGYVFAGRR